MKTAINNVKIFDGRTVLCTSGSVLFDETGILKISSEPLTGDRTIDGTGKTLTPGLIDGHVHLGGAGLRTLRTTEDIAQTGAVLAAELQLVWKYGITTLCNCATDQNIDIHVRNLVNSHKAPGARLIACGKGICITGGHGWTINHQVDDDVQALAAARTQIREGADLVKLFATGGMATKGSVPNAPQLEESQMAAAVKAAEQVGVLTRAHATGLEGAQRAIRAGVRIIDHTQLDEETADLMAEHGAYYCPTIVTRYNILNTTDPEFQHMRAKANPMDLERKKKALNLCLEKGITILAGTDSAGGILTRLGESLWTELNIYAEYGLTNLQVLTAATADAAAALKIDHVTGSVKEGLAADLTLFDGDPTADMQDIRKVYLTFQGGELVYVNPDRITL